MGLNRKKFRISLIILIASGLIIGVLFGIHWYSTYKYNHTYNHIENIDDIEKVSVSSGESYFTVLERTGKTDSWLKRDLTTIKEISVLKGSTYDVDIYNFTSSPIRDWSIKVDILSDCFLNNAWCGKVEIHQFNGDEEQVQTIDLRKHDINSITVNYYKEGVDLLIPLKEGDYFIYYPSVEYDEEIIEASNDRDISKMTVGFILYGEMDKQIKLKANMDYYYGMSVLQGSAIIVYGILAFIWIIALIVYITSVISTVVYRSRMQWNMRMVEESLDVFTRFVDAKDPYTNGHSQRVAQYSKLLAEKLGFSAQECKKVYQTALLHDCGKCYIPDEVLNKPEKLTDAEYEIIKRHTVKGADMLKNFTSVENIQDGAMYHHERYDGKGYPTGKKGEEIPLIARIICVADSFDVMNNGRVYSGKVQKDAIIEDIIKNKGTQFDPLIADIMVELINSGIVKC